MGLSKFPRQNWLPVTYFHEYLDESSHGGGIRTHENAKGNDAVREENGDRTLGFHIKGLGREIRKLTELQIGEPRQ